MTERVNAPRGRHAPPLEVRLDQQRRRLFEAATRVFARVGYADATAEAIAREAGMSKATFYEHFDNKEDCILALFDRASEAVMQAMKISRAHSVEMDPHLRIRGAITAMLEVLASHPEYAQTVVVEIIGAGPRAQERRDRILAEMADYVFENNAHDAATGRIAAFASRLDAFAYVGAIVELVSRQVRTGEPQDVRDLEPVIERVILGLLEIAAKGLPPRS